MPKKRYSTPTLVFRGRFENLRPGRSPLPPMMGKALGLVVDMLAENAMPVPMVEGDPVDQEVSPHEPDQPN